MTPRKKAGPPIGSRVTASLSDQQVREFCRAIGEESIADRVKLPNGNSLPWGLQRAIEKALSMEAGPSTREIKADMLLFGRRVAAAYREMLPETRDLFTDAYLGWLDFAADISEVVKRVVADIDETEQQARDPKLFDSSDWFLSDIIWIVKQCPDVSRSLPSKAYYHQANKYALFNAARAAVKIAHSVAERHAPEAASKLKRLRDCKPSTFVNKLLRARRLPAWLSIS